MLRRGSSFRDKEPEIEKWFTQVQGEGEEGSGPGFQNELADDQLKMIFACCHPSILPEGRLALTLNGRRFRCVRDRSRLPERKATLAQSLDSVLERGTCSGFDPGDIRSPLDSVLKVLSLMFEGGMILSASKNYSTKAMSLVFSRVASGSRYEDDEVIGRYIALMLLQAARLPGRVDPRELSLSCRTRIAAGGTHSHRKKGLYELSHTAEGSELDRVSSAGRHCRCYSVAPTYESTECSPILSLYDSLWTGLLLRWHSTEQWRFRWFMDRRLAWMSFPAWRAILPWSLLSRRHCAVAFSREGDFERAETFFRPLEARTGGRFLEQARRLFGIIGEEVEIMMRLLTAVLLTPRRLANENKITAAELASLDWLAGTWRDEGFDAHYTSPERGMILSAMQEWTSRILESNPSRYKDEVIYIPDPVGRHLSS